MLFESNSHILRALQGKKFCEVVDREAMFSFVEGLGLSRPSKSYIYITDGLELREFDDENIFALLDCELVDWRNYVPSGGHRCYEEGKVLAIPTLSGVELFLYSHCDNELVIVGYAIQDSCLYECRYNASLVREATREEVSNFFGALQVMGLRPKFISDDVISLSSVRLLPEYYYIHYSIVDKKATVRCTTEEFSQVDRSRYDEGNYFGSESEAKLFLKKK